MSTPNIHIGQPVSVGQALAVALAQLGHNNLAAVALRGKQPELKETFSFDEEVARQCQVGTTLAIETGAKHRKSRPTKGRTR